MSFYTAAYKQVLLAASHTPVEWSKAASIGPAKFVELYSPRVDLGPGSGKTEAAIEFALSKDCVLIVTATADRTANIRRRNPTVRAEALDEFARRTKVLDDCFVIFDDSDLDVRFPLQATKRTTAAILKLKPKQFIRVGWSG